jgi:hypothetical protein
MISRVGHCHTCDIAELAACSSLRFLPRYADIHQVSNLLFEMLLYRFGKFRVAATTKEEIEAVHEETLIRYATPGRDRWKQLCAPAAQPP